MKLDLTTLKINFISLVCSQEDRISFFVRIFLTSSKFAFLTPNGNFVESPEICIPRDAELLSAIEIPSSAGNSSLRAGRVRRDVT